MKRYSFFHALILSFFSKSFYRDVAHNWSGTGLAYMAVILALLWIPTIIKMQVGLSKFVDHDSQEVTKQIPAITISHGKVSTDVPTPYFIREPKSGEPIVVIDTTTDSEKLDNLPTQVVMLTRTKFVMRNARETRAFDLSGVQQFYVDRPKVEGWLATGKRWFVPVMYPLLLVFSFIFRAVQMLIYALVGLLFASMLHVTLDYKTLMRLAAVAITPVLVLDLVREFLPVHIPLCGVVGIAIALGYLFVAVKWSSEPEVAPPYQAPPASTAFPG